MSELDSRQRELLRLLWRQGRLSRWELHEHTQIDAKTVGQDIAALLERGIVRECPSSPLGRGRPRVPVEIDPEVRHVVGLAISPGRVEAGRVNLRGQLMGTVGVTHVDSPDKIVPAANDLLAKILDDQTLAFGISATGMLDPQQHVILSGSILQGPGAASLAPLYELARTKPLVLENDMHALAARWLLTNQSSPLEDVLLVSIEDGQVGAALLIAGRPNRGCTTGANELGHTRFFVETDRCYCGHTGCLERICSTPFLKRLGAKNGTLMEHAAQFDASDEPMNKIVDYLSAGLANVCNFIRPNRLILAGRFAGHGALMKEVFAKTRSRLLKDIADRVLMELWNQPAAQSAETAAWLALANLYSEGWNAPIAPKPIAAVEAIKPPVTLPETI